jgi:hypothetical protein
MLNLKDINTKGTYKITKVILACFASIVGFVLTWNGLITYIEEIVEKKISEPEIIEKVKAQIRPMVVFDQNESILVDTGGMQYIESIHVITKQKNGIPQEIIITPKIYLAVAPILESFDDDFVIVSERGKGFQWIYRLGAIKRLALEDSATSKGVNRFRIEVIK